MNANSFFTTLIFFFQTLLLQIWQRLNSAARSRVHPPDNNLSCDNDPAALHGGELAYCHDDYDGNDHHTREIATSDDHLSYGCGYDQNLVTITIHRLW